MHADDLLADRYRLTRAVGSGGMGQVWAGRDLVLERDVAIKLHRFAAEASPEDIERFLREARVSAALQHPNVVTIYDSGTEGDQAFLVMELLSGPSLQTYVREHGPLPEAEAVDLATQIAAGLAAAHRAGVVHRDVKPANLVFGGNHILKIVDFGIARLTQTTTTSGLTAANMVIGSPPYLSPEQFQGLPADERSDLYALGCVLTTMLTGRPPFEGEHALAYAHQHVSVDPPLISERRAGVDPALEALVDRLLCKAPEDRPGSAEEVLEQLAHPEAVPTEPMPTEPVSTVVVAAPLSADPSATAPAGAAAASIEDPSVPVVPVAPVVAFAPAVPPQSLDRPGTRRWVIAAVMALVLAAALVLVITRANAPIHGRAGGATTSASDPTAATGAPRTAGPGKTSGSAKSSASARPRSSATDVAQSTSVPNGTSSASSTRSPRSTPSATKTDPTSTRSSSAAPTATTSTSPSRSSQPTPTGTVEAALSDLRNAAQSVISSGDITDKAGHDLIKRIDQVDHQLDGTTGEAALKKIDDFDAYLTRLSEKGTLTQAGRQRLEASVDELRSAVQPG